MQQNANISQIPQCIMQIPHNVPLCKNGSLWDMGPVQFRICVTGLLSALNIFHEGNPAAHKEVVM